ncbi:alpha-beta hydrolase superfamily lysophospholipase [Saccharothrix saharensis]|uniref:Alpha-beta hydrolase superfamily lysophospholipase n=1 Tax=Saccharothrix saharensis TaxID=571190 RepID=A0A543JQI5_9PSEU|nr:alpha/beta fold hydrolase [Saccharothrix saharensis]TQM85121.1 alpha-beta hydrolase superfamily lysophospholipase [Saccharothrix saharensis]
MLRTILTLSAAASITRASPAGRVAREDWKVRGDAGLLGVREVRPTRSARGRPVLLLHGARVPGVASFDLPVPGGSLAADLARRGHRVFIVDARGYGASDRPPALDAPPSANPPAVTGEQVVRDIAAVVEWARAKTGHRRVDLLGWATGGHWAAWYASEHPGRVAHLVVLNSLYGATDGHPLLGRGSDYEDPARPGHFDDARHGAYRLATGPGLLGGWDASIPVDDKSAWRDPRVAVAYVAHALASDPTSADREPSGFRAPTGALKDSFHLATGRRLWHAGTITARTLVLRGELDFWSRADDLTTLVEDLGRARDVRAAHLERATHFVHLDRAERGRDRLLDEVLRWLR